MTTKELLEKVAKMCEAPLSETGCSLWDVTFEKEGARHVLTVYIDKEGGVYTDDCEKVSRYIDPLLDAKEFDSLPEYMLTVSSAGLERHITKKEHFVWAMGKDVDATFYKAINGNKSVCGALEAFDDETVTIGGVQYNKKDVAGIRLHFEF